MSLKISHPMASAHQGRQAEEGRRHLLQKTAGSNRRFQSGRQLDGSRAAIGRGGWAREEGEPWPLGEGSDRGLARGGKAGAAGTD